MLRLHPIATCLVLATVFVSPPAAAEDSRAPDGVEPPPGDGTCEIGSSQDTVYEVTSGDCDVDF